MEPTLYRYKAFVTKVYDGDTITVDIDLGLHTWLKGEKLRLYRINAPEVRGAQKVEGKISRDYLKQLVWKKELFIETIKDKKGKYGRYLAEIWCPLDNGTYMNANDELVKKGFAVYKEY
ncbi:MAG: thermonuclease family protein [Ignavibacteriaceae bacterium]|nr:thermonuclease family protein [Ignavibacteriaceae bacterium]